MHYSNIPDNEALFNIPPWRIFGHQNPGHVREKPDVWQRYIAQEPGSLFWCHAVISLLTVHYIPYIAYRGRLQNLGADSSKIGLHCVAIPWQQRFTSSYGSRRFAACDCWMQTSVAVNAKRQWLLIAVSHVVLYCVKRNIAANEAHFLGLLPQHGSFSLWCRKGKALCERPFTFALYR